MTQTKQKPAATAPDYRQHVRLEVVGGSPSGLDAAMQQIFDTGYAAGKEARDTELSHPALAALKQPGANTKPPAGKSFGGMVVDELKARQAGYGSFAGMVAAEEAKLAERRAKRGG